MTQQTDVQLIEGFIRGDQAALRELYGRHIPSVFRFVARLAPHDIDVDDVVQDSFVKAWSKLKTFDRSRPFRTWIFAIAKNTLFDALKKKRDVSFSEIESLSGNEDGDQFSVEDGRPLPDELMMRAEADKRIADLLLKLSPLQRVSVVLHTMEGMTFNEIGEVLGEPMDTVKTRYRRGIAALAKLLQESEVESG